MMFSTSGSVIPSLGKLRVQILGHSGLSKRGNQNISGNVEHGRITRPGLFQTLLGIDDLEEAVAGLGFCTAGQTA